MKQKIQSLVVRSFGSGFPTIKGAKHLFQLFVGVLGVFVLVGCGSVTSVATHSPSVPSITTRQSLAYQELTWAVATVPEQDLLDISLTNSGATQIRVQFTKSPLSGRIIYHGEDGAVVGEESLGILSTITGYEVASDQHWVQRIELQSLPETAVSLTVEIVYQIGDDEVVTESLDIAISK